MAEIETNKYRARIEGDVGGGIHSGVEGTPAFFINELRYDGPSDLNSMLTALREARIARMISPSSCRNSRIAYIGSMKQRHSRPSSRSSRQKKGFSTEAPRASSSSPKPALAVQSFEPDPVAVYSIETAAQLAGVPRRTILIYCKHGLVSPTVDPTLWGYWFTADAIRTLRRIENLRHTCGDDFPGIAMILGLLNEVQTLKAQLRAFGR